jgi:16S rRNA processing protein RimM
MDSDAFVEIGRVSKTHGLHGEVSVILAAHLPVDSLVGLEVWFVPPAPGVRRTRVTKVRRGPKGPLFSFADVDEVAAADALRGRTVLADAAFLPEAPHELDPVGFTVIEADRGVLGSVTGVIVTGANDVWVVDGDFGEVLLPVIDEVVQEIDEDSRTARVVLLPGLLGEGR